MKTLQPMGVNTVSTTAICEISLLLQEIYFTSKLNSDGKLPLTSAFIRLLT